MTKSNYGDHAHRFCASTFKLQCSYRYDWRGGREEGWEREIVGCSNTSARPFGPNTSSATTPITKASGAPTPSKDAWTPTLLPSLASPDAKPKHNYFNSLRKEISNDRATPAPAPSSCWKSRFRAQKTTSAVTGWGGSANPNSGLLARISSSTNRMWTSDSRVAHSE